MAEKTFWLPFKTPTVNHLYWHRGNIRIMYQTAKKLREDIIKLITPCPELEGNKLSVKIEIYENWLCKNGSVKKKDIANREKFLIDSIFKGLNIDDRYIYEHTMIKVQSEQLEGAMVKIWTI